MAKKLNLNSIGDIYRKLQQGTATNQEVSIMRQVMANPDALSEVLNPNDTFTTTGRTGVGVPDPSGTGETVVGATDVDLGPLKDIRAKDVREPVGLSKEQKRERDTLLEIGRLHREEEERKIREEAVERADIDGLNLDADKKAPFKGVVDFLGKFPAGGTGIGTQFIQNLLGDGKKPEATPTPTSANLTRRFVVDGVTYEIPLDKVEAFKKAKGI